MAEKLRVLITGSNGLLGQKLVDAFLLDDQVEFLATARGENRHPQTETPYAAMDITNPEQMDAVIDTFNPDVIIHTAAMTQVDDCEFEKESCVALWITYPCPLIFNRFHQNTTRSESNVSTNGKIWPYNRFCSD